MLLYLLHYCNWGVVYTSVHPECQIKSISLFLRIKTVSVVCLVTPFSYEIVPCHHQVTWGVF
nr:MAG TPA: hypothetical protein [Caudoviricetes sp.]